MSSAVIAENYSAAKLKEYICFVEQLGSNIHFHENKWVCSNLRRNNDFSFSNEKNSENLARFFKFCA